MNAVELATLNLSEVRRRSCIVWRAIPDEYLTWKPDADSMSLGESIRHVWASQVGYHEIIKIGKSLLHDDFPFTKLPITSVESEIEMAKPYHDEFLTYVRYLTEDDLTNRTVDRSDVGYIRSVGDFLARIAYHESVHTGQLLQSMRTAGIPRPDIWD